MNLHLIPAISLPYLSHLSGRTSDELSEPISYHWRGITRPLLTWIFSSDFELSQLSWEIIKMSNVISNIKFYLYPSRVKSWLKVLQIFLTWLTLCWKIPEKFFLSPFISKFSKSDLLEIFTISDSNSTLTCWIFEHKYVFIKVKIINRNKEYLITFLTFFIASI